jgi:hypothetical protein
MDTLRFLINARVNTHGFTTVEILAIHSCRVEPALIPYVMTPIIMTTGEAKVNFFFFGRKEMMTTVEPHNGR